LTPPAVYHVYRKIEQKAAFQKKYRKFYDVNRGIALNTGNWRNYWRAIIY
jgi:hypothetical protein